LYRVSTIDSWAIRLISKFPLRSGHNPALLRLENPSADYMAIRIAARSLLGRGDISDALRATYSHLIVDEYQDCTVPQHHIVGWIANVLPTYVLGDPLQAIFGFNEPTVDWNSDVLHHFPPLGILETPWRWRNAETPALGDWLVRIRAPLMAGQAITLAGAPAEVTWIQLPTEANAAHVCRLTAARTVAPNPYGTVLVVGDSTNPAGQRQVASQTPGATAVEAVDLRDLTGFGRSFRPGSGNCFTTLLNFAAELMTNLERGELERRVLSLKAKTARNAASPVETAAMEYQAAPSLALALKLMRELEAAPSVRVFRPEVLRVFEFALEAAASGQMSLYDAVVNARERSRHLAKSPGRRSVGSTLLLKGLEADVVVVLNPAVMTAKHLYVALTRGARKIVVCSPSQVLTPARR
jgi:hypothetical protein